MLDQNIKAELKEKLLKEKESLEKELSLIATKLDGDYQAKFEDFGRDEEENAEETENFANKIAITETLEKKLQEVLAALKRMEDGTYGFCVNCPNEEIPLERLRAYPSASTCLKCQNQ